MLWEKYVFRRGSEVHELWDQLFSDREVSLLYIAGAGFDLRTQKVMRECIKSLKTSSSRITEAKLVLLRFSNYSLDDSLASITSENERELVHLFSEVGTVEFLDIGSEGDGDDELSGSSALRKTTSEVLKSENSQSDIILDVSSLPRVVYLALMTSFLNRLIPNKEESNPLATKASNFQVLVAEDSDLDSHITAEDPSNEIVWVPGFSAAMQAESVQDWPLVWFPMLGESRVAQLEKIIRSTDIPPDAEVCPVVPHPSHDPRRGDRLLLEYRKPLFASRNTPMSNILYVHESQPFEVYRQLLKAMQRYVRSMEILGGCRLVVTPFGSKLITLGAGLACFEIKPPTLTAYGITIPHAEPTRYVASADRLRKSDPEICSLLLTGDAYA